MSARFSHINKVFTLETGHLKLILFSWKEKEKEKRDDGANTLIVAIC